MLKRAVWRGVASVVVLLAATLRVTSSQIKLQTIACLFTVCREWVIKGVILDSASVSPDCLLVTSSFGWIVMNGEEDSGSEWSCSKHSPDVMRNSYRWNTDTVTDERRCWDRIVSVGVSVDLPVSFQWRAEEEREETGSDSEAKAKRKCGMFVCECQRKTERLTRKETILVIVEEECESCSCEQDVQAVEKKWFHLI